MDQRTAPNATSRASREPGSRIGIRLGFVALAASLLATPASAIYQQIRVPNVERESRQVLAVHPDIELMGEGDGTLILLSRPEITEKLRAAGVTVEVEIEDLEAFYAARLQGPTAGGNFGIFHTYSEALAEMQAIHAEFPNLTTAPASIATTGEGRFLYAMKVSDNASVDEPEPEVLFDGVHHAREIMTVEMNLSFMRYLCENYETDQVVTKIVNTREVWFVPIVNPDGFVYNETTNPGGGGLWRKNRRNNGGGCFGVDPNRNYPFQWVGSGSSTDPCNETYRGPSAASEPEIAGLTAFINSRDFVTWQSYHSVAGMVLFPWGYTSAHTPDDGLLRSIATEMASQNGYQVGQPPEILYNVNGGSFDWGYGETSQHTKIFGFTTEIGGSGFWPDPSERDPLIAENLASNLYLCQIAGPNLELLSLTVTGGDGNGRLDPGESVSLVASLRNGGVVANAANVQVHLSCDDPYLVLSDALATLGTLAAGASTSTAADPFECAVLAACPSGRTLNIEVRLTADGGEETVATVPLTVGQPTTIYANDFEEANEAWSSDPSHTATSGAFVRIDPNATGYQPGDDATPAPGIYAWVTAQNSSEGVDDVDNGVAATRSPVFDLAGRAVRLSLKYFFGQRDPGDDAGDLFRISVSNDGGASFPVNLVSVGDVTFAATWRALEVDLADVIGLTSQMVLRVQAVDGLATGDVIEAGVDDVYLYDLGDDNDPPTRPTLLAPADGATGLPGNLALTVTNAVDPEGQPLSYSFRVYSDAGLTQIAATIDGVASGVGSTSWSVTPPLGVGQYYWRACAHDGASFGLYMEAASFTVTTASDVASSDLAPSTALLAGPNPSRGDVRIRYAAPAAPYARLQIIDAAGRIVRSLEGLRWSAGWHDVTWDGNDAAGHRAPRGVYFVRLVLPTEERTIRVVRVD